MLDLRGRLLVATPALLDPNFAGTVVLLLDHSAEGALGIVLNRPSDARVAEAIAEWAPHAADPPVIFVGGPVQPAAVIGLARLRNGDALVEDWEPVLAGVGVLNLGGDPAERARDLTGVRVFAGYAGWGPGQVEAELESGSWFLVPAVRDDGFCADPERLWRAVLQRQGGLFTTVAEDPSLN